MNDSYYLRLNVIDRIEELAKERFDNLSKFSKAVGDSPTCFYTRILNGVSLRVAKLNKIAKVLNVNIEYLFTGKNKKPYNGYIDLEKVKKLKFPRDKSNLQVMRSNLKNGKRKDLNISSMFNILEETKKNINFFITEE